MPLQKVKIFIENAQGQNLEHFFVRANKWGLPAGKIEEAETSVQAAKRELLERTGYEIPEDKLTPNGDDGEFYLFHGHSKDLVKKADPGEEGGYSTEIRWAEAEIL